MNYFDMECKEPAPKQVIRFGKLYISVITSRLIRVSIGKREGATQLVVNRNLGETSFTAEKKGPRLTIRTEDVTFVIKINGRVKAILRNGKKLSNFNRGNLKGTARTLDRKNGACKIGKGIISKNGGAYLDDKTLSIANGITPSNGLVYDRYYFLYGDDYRGALRDFYRLSGKSPFIPKYALGNWWSRYKAYTQEEYKEVFVNFEKRNIPLTVATIDMDWHWVNVVERFGKEAKSKGGLNLTDRTFSRMFQGWTGYSWNTELFPDHKELFCWLKKRGYAITLNFHPSQGIRFFEDQYPEMCNRLGLDPEKKMQIHFDLSNPAFMDAYFDVLHHPYEGEGVDFWWLDWQQGRISNVKGLDPLWGVNHYHYTDADRGDKRGMILSRFAGAGSQRYPIGFSGDTIISWKSLAFQPYFTATAANIGYTWWSHDIGGHTGGTKEEELYLRWVQFGVFSPINRLHSTSNEFTGKEPWKCSMEVENISSEFLRFRHKMLPYLYTASYHTQKEGIALCEPLYYSYKEKEAYAYPNEYVFGGSLLVAPICKKRSDKSLLAGAEVYLPEKKRYTDIFTGRIYRGGSRFKAFRSLDSIPVFAKEGTILPLYRDIDNSYGIEKPLEIWVYRGTGEYLLYEDDGISKKYLTGEYAITRFNVLEKDNEYLFSIKEGIEGNMIIPEREYTIVFKDIESALVTCNGNALVSESEEEVRVTVMGGQLHLSDCVVKKNPPIRDERILMISRYQLRASYKQKRFLNFIDDGVAPHAPKELVLPLVELEQMDYGL